MAYIGTWPSTIGFRTVNFRAISSTKQTTPQSGRRVRVSTAGTRFAGTIQYPQMALASFKPIQAVATQLQGPLNSFDIVLPSISENQSGVTGTTALVNGTNAAGSSTVNLTTNKNSTTIAKAGDVIRFPGHNKVYMLTADATTGGGGAVAVAITPNLIEAEVGDGSTAVTLDDVPFRVTLSRDIQEYKYATDGTVSYEIDIIEEV